MTRAVYKWEFPDDIGSMDIPWTYGDHVVLVGNQNGIRPLPTVWVEHQLPHSEDNARLHVIGTGHRIMHDYLQHVGSAMMRNYQLVWHVYLEYPIKDEGYIDPAEVEAIVEAETVTLLPQETVT